MTHTAPPPPAPATRVGALLREWRTARRLSQLDLALEAGVSSRHLSYVETGKAQPSRDMVARLADTPQLESRAAADGSPNQLEAPVEEDRSPQDAPANPSRAV